MRLGHGWVLGIAVHTAAMLWGAVLVSFGQEFVTPPVGVPANNSPSFPATTSAPVCPSVCRLSLEDARQRAVATNRALVLAHLNVDSKHYATNAGRMGIESNLRADAIKSELFGLTAPALLLIRPASATAGNE